MDKPLKTKVDPSRFSGRLKLSHDFDDECITGRYLGAALNISQVAAFLGVSCWQVRQKLVPAGLPHFRATPRGKLLFYTNPVSEWMRAEIRKQQEGGGLDLPTFER